LEFRPPDAARAARCVKEATGAQHMASAAPASLSCWSATIRRRTPKCATSAWLARNADWSRSVTSCPSPPRRRMRIPLTQQRSHRSFPPRPLSRERSRAARVRGFNRPSPHPACGRPLPPRWER